MPVSDQAGASRECRVGLPGGFGGDSTEAMSLDGLGECAALNV